MTAAVRLTDPTCLVLTAFLDAPTRHVYGLEIINATGLKSGTLYPILRRLKARGWVMSWWEDRDPSVEGRPLRRYYRLTAAGYERANAALTRKTRA